MKRAYYLLSVAWIGMYTLMALPFNLRAQNPGILYGSTSRGGPDDMGTILQLDPVTGNVIMDGYFPLVNPGEHPMGQLVEGTDGKFYGMTNGTIVQGYVLNKGAIYEWDPSTNVYTKRIDFDGIQRGRNPMGSLALFNGRFYGMTMYGGTNNMGVIFEWDPASNLFTKKMDLDATTGGLPEGTLSLFDGKFYGLTLQGGANNQGVIFEWDPVINLYIKRFDLNATTGAYPVSAMTFYQGSFYGMTSGGGVYNYGVIFEWDPVTNNFYRKLDFNGSENGANPYGEITFKDGKGYGMTRFGGINDAGVLFEWDPLTNTMSKKIDLSYASTGDRPLGSLSVYDGKLYGMTPYGGAKQGGVIFEWDPSSNIFIKKIDLDLCTGERPYGSMALSNGKFYGTTSKGAALGLLVDAPGALFEWNPEDNTIIKKIVFSFPGEGYFPCGELTEESGKLYGMTSFGGMHGYGAIFEWDPVQKNLSGRFDFNQTNGSEPYGSLTSLGGNLYGMTNSGGISNEGVLFSWNPVTGNYVKLLDFEGYNGSAPRGALLENNGKLIGMTTGGGTYGRGVIFEWDPGAGLYSKKIDFGYESGASPYGILARYGGKFYGMTSGGGAFGGGVIFEWDPLTNSCTKKFDFDANKGCTPNGSLVLKGDMFYGMTAYGGINNCGVLFKWDPATNFYTKMIDFENNISGSIPLGSLILHNNLLYGLTSGGGAFDKGVIFQWDPDQNFFYKLKDLENATGSHPFILSAFTSYNGPFSSVSWTGNSSNDWYDPSNWTPFQPNSSTQVTIPEVAGNYPTLNQIGACEELILEDGASFIGSEFLKTGNVQVFLDLPANEYHYISSPVLNETFNDLFALNQSGVWAYNYDELSGNWLNRSVSDSLFPGQGYSVRMNQPQLVRFEGSFINNSVDVILCSLNSSGDPDRAGWNLVGNPFPSAILWDELVRDPGVEGAVYAWTGTDYISYINGIGSLTDGIIPANNGFFVKTGVHGESLSVPLSARVHSNIPFYKVKPANLLSVTVEGNSYSDVTFFHFNENASAGFDPDFDARKLWGITDVPQIYSTSDDIPLSINTFPATGNDAVNVGFRCGHSGTFTLDLSGMDSFDENTPVWLEDLLTGDLQNIRTNPAYTYEYVSGAEDIRFRLHFRSFTTENNPKDITVYGQQNKLIIQNLKSLSGEIYIYDLSGREMGKYLLSAWDKCEIPLALPSGCYLVKVLTEKSYSITKVLIRQPN